MLLKGVLHLRPRVPVEVAVAQLALKEHGKLLEVDNVRIHSAGSCLCMIPIDHHYVSAALVHEVLVLLHDSLLSLKGYGEAYCELLRIGCGRCLRCRRCGCGCRSMLRRR